MKRVRTQVLHKHEPVASSQEWLEVQTHLNVAIASIVWPSGATEFTIKPTKKGNGVGLIKEAFIETLKTNGWEVEQASVPNVGNVDAALVTKIGTFAVEWETGNISSSHRSLNRLALGLWRKTLVGGILVLPSRALYRFLTDRIGNFQELAPYFPLYELLPLKECVFIVIEVEHDAEDPNVPPLSKATDGWALLQGGKPAKGHTQLPLFK